MRTASEKDIPFLAKAITESEKSGTETLFYSAVFGLSTTETEQLFGKILEEEIEGMEWCISHFRILECGEEPAACLSAWIEGIDGMSSSIIRAQTLQYFLPLQWQNSIEKLQQASALQIPRTKGALQLECIYTEPAHRGNGYAGRLIEAVIEMEKTAHPALSRAEIQLMGENKAAISSYTKCGFLLLTEKSSENDSILTLLPGKSRVSLGRQI
ncbi:MAG: GNAT family N-acetyltransferase [Bacteroidetes bacterium]|nr:GNAT family N-acetyltransferase [Bacteroidota bacterium]